MMTKSAAAKPVTPKTSVDSETVTKSDAPAESPSLEAQETAKPVESAKTPARTFTGVRYTGSSDVKILTVQDLVAVGVREPSIDLRWDSQNDHTVGVNDVNASTLEYLRSQPDFRVV